MDSVFRNWRLFFLCGSISKTNLILCSLPFGPVTCDDHKSPATFYDLVNCFSFEQTNSIHK